MKASILIRSPKYAALLAQRRLFGHLMSDETYIKNLFYYRMGYPLNLEHPITFAEKLQWLKLYDRKPIYHQMVDKYTSKILINSVLNCNGGGQYQH